RASGPAALIRTASISGARWSRSRINLTGRIGSAFRAGMLSPCLPIWMLALTGLADSRCVQDNHLRYLLVRLHDTSCGARYVHIPFVLFRSAVEVMGLSLEYQWASTSARTNTERLRA